MPRSILIRVGLATALLASIPIMLESVIRHWPTDPDGQVLWAISILVVVTTETLLCWTLREAWKDFRRIRDPMEGDGARTPAANEELRHSIEDYIHSFKGPLATIRTSLLLLQNDTHAQPKAAERAGFLIESSVDRLQRLIDQENQRLKNQVAEIEAPSVIDLGQVVSRLLEMKSLELAACGIAVESALSDKVPVLGDQTSIEILVENILDNAVTFTPAGRKISVSLTKVDGNANLCITDDGKGVDQGIAGNIFDRYVTVSPSTSRRSDTPNGRNHSGLGLWIVKRNVDALGGAVSASNVPGRGLRVDVVLPLRASMA